MAETQETHQSARTRFTIEAKGVRYAYRRFGKEARANTIAPTRLAYTASALLRRAILVCPGAARVSNSIKGRRPSVTA
jgi:hypothetical protein